MGVSEAKVSRWVNGQTRIKADDLNRIATYLGKQLPRVDVARVVNVLEIAIVRIVQDGYWRELDSGGDEAMSGRVLHVAETDVVSGSGRYALEIKSLDDASTTHHVVCIALSALGRTVRADDRVHYRERHPAATNLVSDRLGIARQTSKGLVIIPQSGEASPGLPIGSVTIRGVVVIDSYTYKV
jgi:transcriptional regulator with XRE-family HTH domain